MNNTILSNEIQDKMDELTKKDLENDERNVINLMRKDKPTWRVSKKFRENPDEFTNEEAIDIHQKFIENIKEFC